MSVSLQVFLGGGAQLLVLQQDLIPRSSHLLSTYHLLKHITQSLASSVPIDIMYVTRTPLTSEIQQTLAALPESVIYDIDFQLLKAWLYLVNSCPTKY